MIVVEDHLFQIKVGEKCAKSRLSKRSVSDYPIKSNINGYPVGE